MYSLQASRLMMYYGKRLILNDISIEVKEKEIVGLLGPNGSGKTTCFYLFIGLLRPKAGKIILNNIDITQLPVYKRGKQGLGYLPQESSIFRDLTVEQNIMAALEFRQDLNRQQRRGVLQQLLKEFSLHTIQQTLGHLLSGGERRRTEIARLIATKPLFVLFDEPFAGVDPISVTEIKQLILSLKEKGIGVLINDHNVAETLSFCDRSYVIGEGQILAQGSAQSIVSNEQVRKIYLGEEFSL